MEKDILNKLMRMGLSAEEIQKTYERYMSHLDKIETLENTLVEVLKVITPMVNDWTVCPSCNHSWHNHDHNCELNLVVKKANSVLPK
ncbi:hypothetical protein ACYJ2U_001708 [Clostridium botulinum]